MSEEFGELVEDEGTLYGVLNEPAPSSGDPGETAITATKETLDNDSEDVGETLLLLGG